MDAKLSFGVYNTMSLLRGPIVLHSWSNERDWNNIINEEGRRFWRKERTSLVYLYGSKTSSRN